MIEVFYFDYFKTKIGKLIKLQEPQTEPVELSMWNFRNRACVAWNREYFGYLILQGFTSLKTSNQFAKSSEQDVFGGDSQSQ